MRNLKVLSFILSFTLALLLFNGCRKEEQTVAKRSVALPEVTTVSIIQVGRVFKVKGFCKIDSNSLIIEKGICYDTIPNPTIDKFRNFTDKDSMRQGSYQPGSFIISLKDLKKGVTYFVRAYATNLGGTAYGEEMQFTTEKASSLVVGDDYAGGKIGYILKIGDLGFKEGEIHGIIVAPEDLKIRYVWGGGFSDSIGAGRINTDLNAQKNNAAGICYSLELNGFSDWYLPSKYEFELVLSNMEVIGNFADDVYWSSTHSPLPGNPGWADPTYGYSFYVHPNYYAYSVYDWLDNIGPRLVRAIRYF